MEERTATKARKKRKSFAHLSCLSPTLGLKEQRNPRLASPLRCPQPAPLVLGLRWVSCGPGSHPV